MNDINDERRVHAACVDALYAPAFGDKQAKAIMSEVKVFDEVRRLRARAAGARALARAPRAASPSRPRQAG